MDNENNYITMTDEDGNEIEFCVIDVFPMNDNDYFCMTEGDPDEADEVVIMKVEGDEDNLSLISISDDNELQAVYEEFLRRGEEAEEE